MRRKRSSSNFQALPFLPAKKQQRSSSTEFGYSRSVPRTCWWTGSLLAVLEVCDGRNQRIPDLEGSKRAARRAAFDPDRPGPRGRRLFGEAEKPHRGWRISIARNSRTMGESVAMKTYRAPRSPVVSRLPSGVARNRPRAYAEWKALRRWGKLPEWEAPAPGYLLRLARERSGLTQQSLAERLECAQQAIAQAERWESNPTVAFVRRWAAACGAKIRIELELNGLTV